MRIENFVGIILKFLLLICITTFQVLNICVEMMEDLLPDERAPRDFRVKFPDDVMQETLSGQLWFGAEVRD